MATTSRAPCKPAAPRPSCPKTPVCPECGALECLCRPRFFAGQLLTEQDLNLLDRYIKQSHRLHNRNLHGWGVVNGLIVLCDPCGGVKVSPGYALSPCGDDIVVCEETAVDLCDLIRRCRREEPRPCRPGSAPPGQGCQDLEEDWVLTIRYREWASRGITPLVGAACTTGCGCGEDAAAGTPKPRGAPSECEPSVVCEGFVFEVYRKPEPEPRRDPGRDDDAPLLDLDTPFWQQFLCCAEPLVATVPNMPTLAGDNALAQNRQALANWCCRFRANLLAYFQAERNVRCEIIDHLRAIVCPSANDDGFPLDFVRALLDLLAVWAEGLKNCLCLALLPPAPLPVSDERVPLASIRVRARDCRVLSICNWTTERRLLLTWPTLDYWHGILPVGDALHALVERFCCSSLLDIFDGIFDDIDQPPPNQPITPIGTAPANTAALDTGAGFPSGQASFAQRMDAASGVFASGYVPLIGPRILARLSARIDERGDQTLQLGAVLNAVTSRFKLPTNGQDLSTVERNNLPLLLAAEVLGKPFLADLGRIGAETGIGGLRPAPSGAREAPGEAADLAQLRAQMQAMQARIDAQEAEMRALRRRVDSRE